MAEDALVTPCLTSSQKEPYCQGPGWRPRRSRNEQGTCGACGKPLEGRLMWFCRSPYGGHDKGSCRARYMENHDWSMARVAALRRDAWTCKRCGLVRDQNGARLEVNHLEARNGGGYSLGCWNHQDNLETLCHDCHVGVTAQQRGYTPGGAANRRRLERRNQDQEKLSRWVEWAKT